MTAEDLRDRIALVLRQNESKRTVPIDSQAVRP